MARPNAARIAMTAGELGMEPRTASRSSPLRAGAQPGAPAARMAPRSGETPALLPKVCAASRFGRAAGADVRPMRGSMRGTDRDEALVGKRRVASHALERDYAPVARSLLWKLGYAVLPAEELPDPELRIVREDRLGELAALPPLPVILLTDRREPGAGDARIVGTVRRPAGVPALYALLQSALEEHPRAVPRLPVSLPARARAGSEAFELEVRSISEGGCLLGGAKLPPLDRSLDLTIEFPWGETLRVAALVSYEQGGRVGAVFEDLTLSARARAAKLVGRLL